MAISFFANAFGGFKKKLTASLGLVLSILLR
jgi:hypothetical protein